MRIKVRWKSLKAGASTSRRWEKARGVGRRRVCRTKGCNLSNGVDLFHAELVSPFFRFLRSLEAGPPPLEILALLLFRLLLCGQRLAVLSFLRFLFTTQSSGFCLALQFGFNLSFKVRL